MKTSELIAECRDILDDYSSLVSGEPDELWSNERILRRLNEAQDIVARRAHAITDDTTAQCCNITLVQDQATYALDPVVVSVLSARLSDSDLALSRRSWAHLHPRAFPFPDPDFFDTNVTLTFDAGRPQLFAVDPASTKIEVWRKPDATNASLTLKLRVARLPITRLVLSTDTSPEIKEEWHLDLCDYAAGTLLSRTVNNDAMGGTSQAAVIAGRGMLKDFYAKLEEVRRDLKRMRFAMPRFQFGQWGSDNDA